MSDAMYVYDASENTNNFVKNYWQHYGLKQSPFEESPQFAMYYPLPDWQTHLQFLRDFCFGNHPLMLIEGELGIGKSLLITQFLAQLDSQVIPYEIKGRATMTAAQLIANIAQGFQLPLVLSQPTLREQMNAELALLQQQQKIRLLIVDDADLLPAETLAALVHLACSQNRNHIHLYIVLSCELRLQNHLENLAQEQSHPLYIPAVNLQPLNLEETKHYLKHRLNKAGLSGKMPFTKEMIESIYHLSSGVPGRINRVAQQTLIDSLKHNEARPVLLGSEHSQVWTLIKAHPIKIISFISLIFLVIVFAKLIDMQRSSLFIGVKPASQKIKLAQQQALPTIATQIKTATPTPKPVITTQPAKLATPATAHAALPAIHSQAPQAQKSTTPIPAVSNAANLNVLAMTPEIKKPAAAIYSRDEKKLLAMQGFTLQLLGAWTMADLQHLIAINHLKDAKAFAFKTKYQGKPWYVLVYGNYSTAAQAKAATKTLPKKLQKLHPWVRPLTSVHQAIKNPA